MHHWQSATNDPVMVAVMGATGTGKSAFIRHLTGDSSIYVGDSIDSETSELRTSCYIDATTGRSIMLIDTPGFDDSREGVKDTDTLQKFVDFLSPEEGEMKRLNGIIFMHRISDPRLGGLTRKNLRMFEALCGENNLRNVRIVTTFWDCDGGRGPMRESELMRGPLRSLLVCGAQMCRHLDTAESAQAIMTEFIPLPEVTTQIQKEVAKDIPLGDTTAGRIIDEDLMKLETMHQEELTSLRGMLDQADQSCNGQLRTTLEDEGEMLEEQLMHAEVDRQRLAMTVPQLRDQKKKVKEVRKKMGATIAAKAAELRNAQNAGANDAVIALERELARLQKEQQKAEYYLKRGIVGGFLGDWFDLTIECAKKGNERSGYVGGLAGGIAGVCVVGPAVAATQLLFGRYLG